MNTQKQGFAPIIIILVVVVIGITYLMRTQKNTIPVSTQTTDKTANWKTYVNVDNTFNFKYPDQWIIQPKQVYGSRSVTEFRFQNNPLFTVTLFGNYNQITGQPFKTLEEYLGVKNSKSKGFMLDGIQAKRVTDPGEAGHVLPYEEVVAFSKDNKFIVSVYFEPDYYPQAAKNKTFDQILSTFKFLDSSIINNTDNYNNTIKILQAIPEIQTIENAVIKNGRKTFFMQNDINGDVVNVSFTEDGFPDQHTTRIDTFNVNIQSKVITVVDVMSGGKDISLEDWKKTVKERFP